jgi:hypothetical protein
MPTHILPCMLVLLNFCIKTSQSFIPGWPPLFYIPIRRRIRTGAKCLQVSTDVPALESRYPLYPLSRQLLPAASHRHENLSRCHRSRLPRALVSGSPRLQWAVALSIKRTPPSARLTVTASPNHPQSSPPKNNNTQNQSPGHRINSQHLFDFDSPPQVLNSKAIIL